MTARALCDICKIGRWCVIKAGRGYCSECISRPSRRKNRRRGGRRVRAREAARRS